MLHFALGGIGIMLGYGPSWRVYLFGALYFAFVFAEMYMVMPITICPNCVYYGRKDAVYISGLNVVSVKIAKKGDKKDLRKRAQGASCHNKMYIASFIILIVALIPAMIINFSQAILAIFIVLLDLLIFRFFVLFTRVVCIHCSARNICPNTQAIGLSDW